MSNYKEKGRSYIFKKEKVKQIRVCHVAPSQQAPLISAVILEESSESLHGQVMALPDSESEINGGTEDN